MTLNKYPIYIISIIHLFPSLTSFINQVNCACISYGLDVPRKQRMRISYRLGTK